jgi:hypothetical protein
MGAVVGFPVFIEHEDPGITICEGYFMGGEAMQGEFELERWLVGFGDSGRTGVRTGRRSQTRDSGCLPCGSPGAAAR